MPSREGLRARQCPPACVSVQEHQADGVLFRLLVIIICVQSAPMIWELVSRCHTASHQRPTSQPVQLGDCLEVQTPVVMYRPLNLLSADNVTVLPVLGRQLSTLMFDPCHPGAGV